MGDKGEDVEQMTTGRIRPSSPVLYPAEPLGRVHTMKQAVTMPSTRHEVLRPTRVASGNT